MCTEAGREQNRLLFVGCNMQGRQASIWGLLNHLRLTHPSSSLLGRQLIDQQAVDRTMTSSAEACKPDRCSGAVAAATNGANNAHDIISAHMVSVGPHGSIRCTSPVHRSLEAQQHKKRQLSSAPCPYHDHETITISLVQESGLYTPPERSVSPQRSQRGHSPAKQRGDSACSGGGHDSYVRIVAVGPAVVKHQHRSGQGCDKQDARQLHAATPQRCPEPAAAAAAAAQGSRKAALTQLRIARRRQQQQLTPADVEQAVAERMCARNKQGAGAHWSSRKVQKEQQMALSDLGKPCMQYRISYFASTVPSADTCVLLLLFDYLAKAAVTRVIHVTSDAGNTTNKGNISMVCCPHYFSNLFKLSFHFVPLNT